MIARQWWFLLAAMLVEGVEGLAQLSVRGRVVDAQQRAPIPGATVLFTALPDATQQWGAVADSRGEFRVELPRPGQYRLRVTSVGYKPLERVLSVRESHTVGDLALEAVALQAGQITVEAVQERAQVKQDTVEYAASAYKVNPDATAEDLVRKMPGVTIEGGQIRAHGETVQRVLVDGREFFGQDPLAVLRNLPADVVQSVQLFDREGERARLTGIRDPSSTERTLNIITNPALRTGRFGRIYGGYGSDTRYQAGATINVFRGDLRMSLVGMSNNVNQQNFAIDDVLGVLNFAGQSSPGGGPPPSVLRMMFQGGRFPGPPPGMRGGPSGPFAQMGTFFVPEQSGINTAHALGLMYSNRWKSGVDITGSYFFNALVNATDGTLQRQYFNSDTLGLFYTEHSHSEGTLGTHRLSLRAEVPLDTSTTLLFAPRITFQPTSSSSMLGGFTLDGTDTLSQVDVQGTTNARVMQSYAQLLFVHRFAAGRSLSVEVEGEYNPQRQEQTQSFLFSFRADTVVGDSSVSQQLIRDQSSASVTMTATYSEPLDSLNILQFRYVPSWQWGDTEQEVWRLAPTGERLALWESLQSNLQRRVWEQRAGVAYLYQGRVFQGNVRLDYSWQRLQAEEQRAAPWSVGRHFGFWIPFLMVEYRPGRLQNLRMVYRPFVTLPSPSQLQQTVDNSNPMALVTGNPELLPSYTHLVFARYQATDPFSGRLFFALLRVMYGRNYIGTATLLAARDTVIAGIPLPSGGRYTVPVNLDGYWSGRLFSVFGLPAPWLRSTLTVNASVDYTRIPSLVNGAAVRTDWYAPALGLSLSSNWSERVDFALSYTLAYNRVQTTAPTGSTRYLQHRLSADVTFLPWGSWVLASQFRWSKYNGLGGRLDRPIALLNLAVGYRFLENNAAEIRLFVADVLGQNQGISRSVTGQYVEDSATQVLRRYAMLQFSYRLRNFAL